MKQIRIDTAFFSDLVFIFDILAKFVRSEKLEIRQDPEKCWYVYLLSKQAPGQIVDDLQKICGKMENDFFFRTSLTAKII